MKRVVIVIAALAAVVGVWFWHGHHATTIAPSPPSKGSASVPVNVPIASHDPARAEVAVSDAKGPVARATVRFVDDEGTIQLVTATADGVAHAELAPGTWTISAAAPGHLPNAAAPRKISSGETANVSIVLATGGRPLTGLVTDTSGGPIAGARIDAALLGAHAHAGAAVASTFTATDGKYALTIGEGQATVAVNHPDYAPQQRYVEISDAGAVASFQLVPGGVIEGVVQDQTSHAPVANATVDAALDRTTLLGEMGAHHITAGADGKFRITGLRPGAYALTAHAENLYSPTPTIVGLGVAEQVADVVLIVGRGATIRGIVVDEHDQPVADVEVHASAGNRGSNGVKTDAKGAFAISGLGPGNYSLDAEGGEYLWLSTTPVAVGLEDVAGVKVRVHRAVHIKGHVEPREVCDVELEAGEGGRHFPRDEHGAAHTAEDGAFELGPIRSIEYVAEARCSNGDEGSAKVAAGATDVVVAVKPGGTIHGRVVDGKGKPIAGASINAGSGGRTEITNGMVTSGASAVSSETGEFELANLSPATYQLSVLDHGRALPMKNKATAKVTLAAAEHKTGVELVVDRPDGAIQGVVTGPDGKPLADAWVSVEQSFDDMIAGMIDPEAGSHEVSVEARDDGGDSNSIAPVLTDANGQFKIANLPRVPWTVTAEAQAGKLRGRLEKITPDATVTIPIASIRELTGTLHVTGTPPEYFSVELEGATNAQRTFVWTDGTFSFARVDPGSYTVTATSSAGTGEAKVVVADNNAHVDITIAQDATITGKLVDPDGKPVPDLGVVAVPDTGDGRLQIRITGEPESSGPDGTFRISVKPGKLTLAVMTGTGSPVIKPGLTLASGQTIDVGPITIPKKP